MTPIYIALVLTALILASVKITLWRIDRSAWAKRPGNSGDIGCIVIGLIAIPLSIALVWLVALIYIAITWAV